MRILVVGAGAVGGFYGAALSRAGRDVTFLVRPERARRLRETGLSIESPDGNFTAAANCIIAGEINAPFDLISLSVKSYSLAAAMDDIAPAIGPGTMILPMLNGMAHLDILGARFDAAHVLGGMTQISATLDAANTIQVRFPGELVFGEQAGGTSPRVQALGATFAGAPFVARASENVLQDMWQKWIQVATGAGMTCMMRASVGDILAAPRGRETMLRAFAECRAVAEAAGYPPRPEFVDFITGFLTTEGSPMKWSMLRDIERGGPTEGAHVLGALAQRARALGVATPILDLACVHLGAYEAVRG